MNTASNSDKESESKLKGLLTQLFLPPTGGQKKIRISKYEDSADRFSFCNFLVGTYMCIHGVLTIKVLAEKANEFLIDFTKWSNPEIIAMNIMAIVLPSLFFIAGIMLISHTFKTVPSTKIEIVYTQELLGEVER